MPRVNVASLLAYLQFDHGILGASHQGMLKNFLDRAAEPCKVTRVFPEGPRLLLDWQGGHLFRNVYETEGPLDQRMFQRQRCNRC